MQRQDANILHDEIRSLDQAEDVSKRQIWIVYVLSGLTLHLARVVWD
jgi:hypothetical protein